MKVADSPRGLSSRLLGKERKGDIKWTNHGPSGMTGAV